MTKKKSVKQKIVHYVLYFLLDSFPYETVKEIRNIVQDEPEMYVKRW